MLNEIKSVEGAVKHILESYEATRDDDTLLIIEYLNINHQLEKRLGDQAYREFKRILREAPSFESIRRCRQKIQEQGFYRGKNYLSRKREAIAMRDYYRKQTGLF